VRAIRRKYYKREVKVALAVKLCARTVAKPE